MKSTKGLLWKRNTLEGHGRINNLFSSGLWTLLYKQMMPGDVATILRNHKGSIQKTKTLTAEGGWARTSLVAQGKDSVLPMQGAWVWSPVRELDPTRMPQLRPSMAKINNKLKKKKKRWMGRKTWKEPGSLVSHWIYQLWNCPTQTSCEVNFPYCLRPTYLIRFLLLAVDCILIKSCSLSKQNTKLRRMYKFQWVLDDYKDLVILYVWRQEFCKLHK